MMQPLNILESLERLEGIVDGGRFPHLSGLAPGLSAKRLNQLESDSRRELWDELRALYAWRNGGDELFPGNHWFPLSEALQRGRVAKASGVVVSLFRQGRSADLIVDLEQTDSSVSRLVDGARHPVLEYESLSHLIAVVADGYERGAFFVRQHQLDVRPMAVKALWMRHASDRMRSMVEEAWTRLQLEVDEAWGRASGIRRRELVDKLTLSCDPRALPLLRPLLEDGDDAVRAAAVRALGTLRDHGIKRRLPRLLVDNSDLVRVHATETAALLVDPEDEDLREPLVFNLEDKLAAVRDSATAAVSHMRLDAALPLIRKILMDDSPEVALEAVRALERSKDPDSRAAVEEAREHWRSHAPELVRAMDDALTSWP